MSTRRVLPIYISHLPSVQRSCRRNRALVSCFSPSTRAFNSSLALRVSNWVVFITSCKKLNTKRSDRFINLASFPSREALFHSSKGAGGLAQDQGQFACIPHLLSLQENARQAPLNTSRLAIVTRSAIHVQEPRLVAPSTDSSSSPPPLTPQSRQCTTRAPGATHPHPSHPQSIQSAPSHPPSSPPSPSTTTSSLYRAILPASRRAGRIALMSMSV
jgi:hypothetical protein